MREPEYQATVFVARLDVAVHNQVDHGLKQRRVGIEEAQVLDGLAELLG